MVNDIKERTLIQNENPGNFSKHKNYAKEPNGNYIIKKNRISEKFKIYWMGRMEIVKRKSVNLEKDKYKNIINMHNRVKLLRTNNKEKILKAARIKYHANIGEQ